MKNQKKYQYKERMKLKSMKMKYFNKIILIFIFVGLVLSGCVVETEQKVSPTSNPIVIGYCPTMHPIVQNLVKNRSNIQAIQFDNSSLAIQSLNSGTVNVILIGRSARDSELNQEFQHILLNDGYTLIAKRQSVIPFENLKDLNIFTSEEISEAQKILPLGTSITHIQDPEKALSEMDGLQAVLLRWSKVPSSSYQLLIPIDGQGNKIPAFRSPHLYYRSEIKDDLLFIINELSTN